MVTVGGGGTIKRSRECWLEDTPVPEETPEVDCLENLEEALEKALWQDCSDVMEPR